MQLALSDKAQGRLFIGLIALLIGVVVYLIIRKNQIKKRTIEVRTAIRADIGLMGEDIDQILYNVKPDAGYRVSEADILKLWEAKQPWYLLDRAGNFKEVLTGKTKAQIKSIMLAFQNKYGKKLNSHINEVLSDVNGYDKKTYEQILFVVKSAR
jgi:hypothetical protein